MCKPEQNPKPGPISGYSLPVVTDKQLLELARARGVSALREIASLGRAFVIESACPWTSRLLKRLDSFEASIAALHLRDNSTLTLESAREQFLFRMSGHPDPVVLAVARLELALLRVRQGGMDEYLVEWDRNPELVFQALRSGSDLPPAEPNARYRTCISRDIPELVRCERESSENPLGASA
jgi:hypothetical protein